MAQDDNYSDNGLLLALGAAALLTGVVAAKDKGYFGDLATTLDPEYTEHKVAPKRHGSSSAKKPKVKAKTPKAKVKAKGSRKAKPGSWQEYVSKRMKQGHAMADIAADWQAMK